MAGKENAMKAVFDKVLMAHPRSVDETYFQHMRFALRFSAGLFYVAFAALVHAFLPCLFERTASRKIAASN